MNLTLPESDRPTQVAHPNRSTGRTVVVSLAALIPVLYPVLEKSVGPGWAAATIGLGITGSAILARLMVVPEVEAFLQQVLPALAAAPRNRTEDGSQ